MQDIVTRHMDNTITRKQEQQKTDIFQRNYVLTKCSINNMEKTLPTDTDITKWTPKSIKKSVTTTY